MPVRHFFMLLGMLWLLPVQGALGATSLSLADIQRIYPDARSVTDLDGDVAAYLVSSDRGQLGYVLSTAEVAPIAAYSGRPIDSLVGIGEDGRISGVAIRSHQEPILVIGVSDADLAAFIGQFTGHNASDRIRVGAHGREGYIGIDGISGATITTMVLARSINKSVGAVANAYGIPQTTESATTGPADFGQSAAQPESIPEWYLIWQERAPELSVLGAALLVLLTILFFQDSLVKNAVLFHRLRLTYLVFTVLFIGVYCSGQLSVVNLLAFFHSLTGGFSWDTLLLEPVVFILWAFVAVSILLWGRGVYCGWLCPFGAAQDLISKLANRLGFEGYRLPQMVHERLWAIKYFILILLVGLSLDSMVNAARLAEVEPFKTVFVLQFQREPMFVVYALALLAVSAFNSKFYCKYICPLGAGLSFIARFRVFDWLRRRSECGQPCQSCAHQCQIAAIKPDGNIIENECHYCLECQVTYWDDHRCPPLIDKRKRLESRRTRNGSVIARDEESNA